MAAATPCIADAEFELMATTDASVPAASSGRSPSSVAIAPK
jgi:hypothetical protein